MPGCHYGNVIQNQEPWIQDTSKWMVVKPIFEYHARASCDRHFVRAVRNNAATGLGRSVSEMAPRVRARDLFIYRKVSYPPDNESELEVIE